jgi:hypothetical protein
MLKGLLSPSVLKAVAVTLAALYAVHNVSALSPVKKLMNFDQ